jgi:hypothetical protein
MDARESQKESGWYLTMQLFGTEFVGGVLTQTRKGWASMENDPACPVRRIGAALALLPNLISPEQVEP